MFDLIFLTWGLIPVGMGLGFIFTPRLIASLEKAYTRRARAFQRRLLKAHRTTGLFLLLVGVVVLTSYFDPTWIYNTFLVARLAMGVFFPQFFQVTTQTAVSIPTYWI